MAIELAESPGGCFREDRVSGVRPGFERGTEARESAVAHGDGKIAAEAVEAGALDGRAEEPCAEGVGIHRGQPVEGGIDELGARRELGVDGDGRFTIPGADILADVAAEDLAADAVAEVFGDVAALLDGQVRDAAGGVHLIRA